VDDDCKGLFRVERLTPDGCRDPLGLCSLHASVSWAMREAETRAMLAADNSGEPRAFAVYDDADVKLYTALRVKPPVDAPDAVELQLVMPQRRRRSHQESMSLPLRVTLWVAFVITAATLLTALLR
jgi:hypothetical protein